MGAPWWPSEVLTILRYPNHNYKIASVPKIRFVRFLRRANPIPTTRNEWVLGNHQPAITDWSNSRNLFIASETFFAHCKALGIGNAVMERLHYIYGKALADKRGKNLCLMELKCLLCIYNLYITHTSFWLSFSPPRKGSHVSMLSAMGSPASSVQDALDSLTDSSLQQTLYSKSSLRGSQRWRGIPLSSHRFSSRNTHSKVR